MRCIKLKKSLINYIQNGKNDELYTPNYAIEPLIKYLYDLSEKIGKPLKAWECTDYGDSNITHLLNYYDFEVVSTHINNFNFLTDTPSFDFDIIITNPPYSLKDEFLEKIFSEYKPIKDNLIQILNEVQETYGYIQTINSVVNNSINNNLHQYCKNLFTSRSSKREYVASKTITLCFFRLFLIFSICILLYYLLYIDIISYFYDFCICF